MIIYAPPTAGKSFLQPSVDTDDVILDYMKEKFSLDNPTHADWMPHSNHDTRTEVFEKAIDKLENSNELLVTNFTDVPVDIAFRFEDTRPLAVRWYELGRGDFYSWLLTPANQIFNLKAPIQVYLGDGCFVGDVVLSDLSPGEYHVRKFENYVFVLGKKVLVYRLKGNQPEPLSEHDYESCIMKREDLASKERDIEDVIYNTKTILTQDLLDQYKSIKDRRAQRSLATAALFMSATNNLKEKYLMLFAASPEGKRKMSTTGIRGSDGGIR